MSAPWICRGWPEDGAPDDAPHQWMHAYYEVPLGERCDICHATEGNPARWRPTVRELADMQAEYNADLRSEMGL